MTEPDNDIERVTRVDARDDEHALDDPLAAVRADHNCFGCGRENPTGLRLRFASDDGGVVARFVPSDVHQGFDGVVHGGMVCTVLDEAMAWATAAAGHWAMTGEMRTRFRRPLRAGEETCVRATITSRRGRIVFTEAELRLSDGDTVATATGTFIQVNAEQERLWRARYIDASHERSIQAQDAGIEG